MKINATIKIENPENEEIIKYLSNIIENESTSRFEIKVKKENNLIVEISANDLNIFNSIINRLIKLLITIEKINNL